MAARALRRLCASDRLPEEAAATAGTLGMPLGAPLASWVAARVPFRRRTRAVAWAKVLLPLAALALMSTTFLLARGPQGPAEIPFAALEEMAGEPGIDAPHLAGLAADGTAIAFEAARLTPLGAATAAGVPGQQGGLDVPGVPGAFVVEDARLDTRSPDGLEATLTAAAGVGEAAARTLRLTGGVAIDARSGRGAWSARAPEVAANLTTGSLEAMGGVAATAPFGRVEAQSLLIDQGRGEGARMVFTGGVRLLYQPPAQERSGSGAP